MGQKKGFTLPAKPLKAAQYFQAKRDVRDYLNGILVDKSGFIVAGNQYDKKDGRLVGGYETVFRQGEKPNQQQEVRDE